MPLRLLVIGVVGVGVSLYLQAAHRQQLRWKRDGDPRAGRWEDRGDASNAMLPIGLVIVALVWLLARLVVG